MRTNPAKRALREGKPTFGTWLSLGDLFATRLLARMNFAWLTLDMEHGAIDWSQAAMIFAAIADAGGVPLARVPKGNHDYIKRTLDAGAWGIVVPMVDTVEQAQTAIRAAKYPPVGNRSLGGGMHSINFDTDSGEYFKRANDEIMVVLQTESPTGVANAEEIYSLSGVSYEVVISGEALQSAQLGPGMGAVAEVVLQKRSDVLVVPRGAVNLELQQPMVDVVNVGRVDPVSVTTGLTSGPLVEITEGLQEGDVIRVRYFNLGALGE